VPRGSPTQGLCSQEGAGGLRVPVPGCVPSPPGLPHPPSLSPSLCIVGPRPGRVGGPRAGPPRVEVTRELGGGSVRGSWRPQESPQCSEAGHKARCYQGGGVTGCPSRPHSAAPHQSQPRPGHRHLPLRLRAGGGSSDAAGAAVPARDPPIPPPGRGAHGAWGGRGAAGGATGPGYELSPHFLSLP